MHIEALHPLPVSSRKQAFQVLDVRVHPAIRHQSDKMHGLILSYGMAAGLCQHRIPCQRTVLHRLANLDQVLINHPAGPDIHVAYLRIAHLPLGQSYRQTRGIQLRMGIFVVKAVDIGRMGLVYGRHRLVLRNTPAIQDYKKYFFIHLAKLLAAKAKFCKYSHCTIALLSARLLFTGIILVACIDMFKKLFASALFILALLPTLQAQQQEDVLDQVASIIKAGNARELARYFQKEIDLNLNGDENTYSRARAEAVLKSFFDENPPVNFEINHQGASRSGARYAIGNYKNKTGSYRVWIKLKETSGRNLITEISFIKEE